VERASLTPAPYNPRSVSDSQLAAICRSIVEFGIVDPFIARREDGLIIGGHQRYKAIEKLLSGPFKYRNADGKNVAVKYELPDGKVPVVFLEGLTDERTKLLNLSLNRVSGDWEHDALATLLKDLAETTNVDALLVTGFSSAEITDYIDLANEGDNHDFDANGAMPQQSTAAPKLQLDFSSAELRDAVKKAVAATNEKGVLSGDALARLLGISVRKKRKAAA